MGQDVDRAVAHVLGNAEVPSLPKGCGLRRPAQRERAARRRAGGQVVVKACGFDEIEEVADEALVELDPRGPRLEPKQVCRREDRFESRQDLCVRVLHQYLSLAGAIGIADRQAHQESIQLAFRQRVRSVMLQRILGGDDEKGARERVGLAVDADRSIAHGLEQRRLRPRIGPIDLVGEYELCKEGTGMKDESRVRTRRGRFGNLEPREVSREQVVGELNPFELGTEGAREGASERGLPDAGDVLEQDMPSRDQALDGAMDDRGLAVDDPFDLFAPIRDPGRVVVRARSPLIASFGVPRSCPLPI